MAPGWLRAAWMTPLFAAIGFGLVVGLRALAGLDPVLDWQAITTVAFLTAAPIGYLGGDRLLRLLALLHRRDVRPGPRTTRATARGAGRTTSG